MFFRSFPYDPQVHKPQFYKEALYTPIINGKSKSWRRTGTVVRVVVVQVAVTVHIEHVVSVGVRVRCDKKHHFFKVSLMACSFDQAMCKI